MDFSLTQLQRLAALSGKTTFAQGADTTHRSQAAFSRSIAALESGLGASLIDRSGYKHGLTPCGQLVLQHAQRVLAEAQRLAEAVEAFTAGTAGTLRLGLGPTPSAILGAPLLVFAAAQSDAFRLQITPGRTDLLEAALHARQLDALVVDASSILPSKEIEIFPLAALPVGVLARTGHPLARQRSVSFNDLLDYPLLSTQLSDEMSRYMTERFGPRAHPDSLIQLQSEDVASLLSTAAASDALYVGALAAGQPAVAAGALCRLAFRALPTYSTRYAFVCLAGRAEAALAQRVRKVAAETLRSYVEQT